MEELLKLGKNLKIMREAKKITQAEAEALSGLKQGYISKIEHGKVDVTYTTLLKYCKSLKISIYSVL